MGDFSDELATLANSQGGNGSPRGVISALGENGTVNVIVNGGALYGIPCSTSYSPRKPGDVVQLVYAGGVWVVIGKLGADPAFVGPTTNVTKFQAYSMNTNAPYSALGGMEVGINPAYPGTPAYLALGYWNVNTSTNILTTGAAGKTNVYVYVARTQNSVDPSPVSLKLIPHNVDQLPLSANMTVYPSDQWTDVIFTLERGEQKMLTLPPDWVTAIKAATPTIRGFVISPNPTVTDATSRYIQLSSTAGSFRAV